MSAGDEDVVEIFETDAETGADHGPGLDATDHLRNGPARAPRTHRFQTRWLALPVLDRRAVEVSAAALVVAVLAAVSALRAHPGVHRSVRTTVIPAPVVSVDVFGCPRGRQCRTSVNPPAVLAAAHGAVPGAQVTYAVQATDVHTGAVYRTVLRLAARDTFVQVNSQCVPGAAPVIGVPLAVSQVSGTTLTPLSIDEPTPPGLKVWAITLPNPRSSARSCGIDVRAESSLDQGIDGRAIDTIVNLLADDPRLMASP